MNIAIIPARGGSQRIPQKNIRLFHGRPMLAWSIQTAIDSGCFDRVIVSTDDEAIASIARDCGAHTPFMRPAALSDHHSTTGDVMAHAVAWLQAQGLSPQAVCCIYATAPFLQASDLQNARRLLDDSDVAYVFSATAYDFPIQRAFHLDAQGRVQLFQPQHLLTRSQDLIPAFHDAAQFYWAKPLTWLEKKPVFAPHSMPFLLPKYRVQDIDTPEDWIHAEHLFALLSEPQQTTEVSP